MSMSTADHSPALIRFGRDAGAFTLETEQRLGAPLAEVFDFFADARNLQELTPSFLHFEIRSQGAIEMRAGTLIDYRLRLHGVPLGWRTLISSWERPNRFVDEQVRGPYLLWRHEHRFEPTAHGSVVYDRVSYRVLGGSLVERLIVRPDLQRIFAFRQQELARRFGRA
jgi:ligand-binding SRPBCC domain-containing protein